MIKVLTLLILTFLIIVQAKINDKYETVEYPYEDKPEIYKIDGIEYVDTSNRNSTLRVVLQESFF